MLKRLISVPLTFTILLLLNSAISKAQCPIGFTQAQLNWDYLDYYFNSGGGNPYTGYISDAREMSQRFGIGTNWLTIATSSNALVNPGTGAAVSAENATHTGDIAGYTGYDVQYNPSVNGQTITITFNTPVRNVAFTLYDIDLAAVITVTAADPLAGPLVVNAVTQPGTILTVAGAPGKVLSDLTNAGAGTALGNASNLGSATIGVPGTALNPVKSITITCTTIGTDPVFWLSDINACVSGSFPSNWHQGFNNQPFQGSTQNQPDYFLVTPDNNSCYMMDPATGKCWWLFTDASKTYMNSFSYDPNNKILYYISENVALDVNNKALKKYDFNTETISTVIADIGTTLNIPTFNSGVESAAGSFYNGYLYFGIEGGQSTSAQRESIVWCVDLSTNTAYQIFGSPSYDGTGIIHDWADILVKDGVLVNYNSARRGANYSYSSYTHFNMMTGAATRYNNPSSTNKYSGQAGMSWNGNMYMIYDSVWLYNAGVISSKQQIAVQTVPGDPAPPAWSGNAGDGSDPFRPKCDFGDAPATYDPNPVSPAVHERSELIRIGATWDKEWVKRGVTGNNDVDDGLAYVPFMPQGSGAYLAQVSVFNNNGANATLCAWLDYNGNGVFDASEGITPITVPNSAVSQNFYLYWPSFTTPLLNGQTTYLRIRITSAAAGMTTSHATGYFTNGEVEDYIVNVDNYPLSTQMISFDAHIINNKAVLLSWTSNEEANTPPYEIQRSANGSDWQHVDFIAATGKSGQQSYEYTDANPLKGLSYYRLKFNGDKYSNIKSVRFKDLSSYVSIFPNPATEIVNLSVESEKEIVIHAEILNTTGHILFQQQYQLLTGVNRIILPSGNYPSGTYFLRVRNDEGEVVNKKFVIKK